MSIDSDVMALDVLQWAFSGQKRMSPLRQGQIKAIARQARAENRETPGKRRSRFWGLGPKWGRLA